jgi:pimeloyl-ACP methyl ester carboxylesterase
MLLVALLTACGGRPEPIDLPADASERGAPVGVRTVSVPAAAGDDDETVTIELWYPAPEANREDAAEPVSFDEYLPDSVLERLVGLELPTLDAAVIRDAPLRVPEEGWPVLLFSHGLGGMRVQSATIAAHLASRGYVVAAPDHNGRMLGDLLPCVFSPTPDDCNLAGLAEDPGPTDLAAALAWLDAAQVGDDPLSGALNLDQLGLYGHSAGGGSTATAGDEELRFTSLAVLSAGAVPSREMPTMLLTGTCDGIVPYATVEAARAASDFAVGVALPGAGHLAPSDLCELDLAKLGEEWLEGRDDLNEALYDQLLTLGIDGCEGVAPAVERDDCDGTYMPLTESAPVIRGALTDWFDATRGGKKSDAPQNFLLSEF